MYGSRALLEHPRVIEIRQPRLADSIMEENLRPGHRTEAVRPTMTRLSILTALLCVLNALPPIAAIWKDRS